MDSRYQLRPASFADLDALVALERASFTDPWSAEQLRDALGWPGAVTFVAADHEVIAGYLLGRVVVDQAEILSLAIEPACRRSGIARRLLTTALAAMRERGAHAAWLEVRVSNDAARGLYTGAGFVDAGRRRGYYRHPLEDAMILRKDLP